MSQKNKILLIVILFLCMHGVLYYLFYFLAGQRNELVRNLNQFKEAKNTDVLFLGDSHVVRSIDLRRLEQKVQTLAYYGQNNIMSYYQLKYCIDNNYPKPAYLILPCDLVTFSKGAGSYRNNKFYYYSFIPLSELKYFGEANWNSYYNYFKVKLFPYSDWQNGLDVYNANRQMKGKNKFSDLTESERQKSTNNFIQNEMACVYDKTNLYSPASISYLKKTLELCKNNNIRPVFVKFPCTQELLNEVRMNVDPEFMHDRKSEQIITAYKAPILNFENIFSNKNYLFFDCHHLNDSGRAVFTEQFKVKLDSLLKIY